MTTSMSQPSPKNKAGLQKRRVDMPEDVLLIVCTTSRQPPRDKARCPSSSKKAKQEYSSGEQVEALV